MRTLKINDYQTLCVPDVDGCGKLATYDEIGWVNIGNLGDDAILIGRDEWPAFVAFINEVDAHMLITTTGAYAAEEAGDE